MNQINALAIADYYRQRQSDNKGISITVKSSRTALDDE